MDNVLGFTIDVFGPVPLRGNDTNLFRDSNINQRMAELGEHKIFGDSAYRGGNHSHCAYYGTDAVFNSRMKSVRISIEWNYMTSKFVCFCWYGTQVQSLQILRSCAHLHRRDIIQEFPCEPLREPNHELFRSYTT